MPDTRSAQVYRIDRPGAGADRLVLRCDSGDRTRYWVIAQYQGPELPATLIDPVIEARGDDGPGRRAWRLTSAEGRFDFRARAVDRLEECAALYAPLHRPFVLRAPDRLVVRVLMWLLRLPAGARWMRRWHANRR